MHVFGEMKVKGSALTKGSHPQICDLSVTIQIRLKLKDVFQD